ncbi:MAG: PAS domain-containing protein [Methanotrichaceae archaeon]|nr:PAS domain-containing protein [Methanotrichaceae archaeon]
MTRPHNIEEHQPDPGMLSAAENDQHHEIDASSDARNDFNTDCKRYQDLFGQAPDSYLFTDLKGNIQETNPAAQDLFKVNEHFLKGKPLIIFIAKEDHLAFNTNLDRLMRGQKVQSWETFINPRRGGPIPVVLSVDYIDNCRGQLIGLCWILHDMRKSKQMDKALIRQREIDETIANLSRALLADASIEYISTIFLENAKRITGSTIGYLGFIDSETGSMICPTMTEDVWELCQINDKNILFNTLGGQLGHNPMPHRSLFCNDIGTYSESSKMPPGHILINRFISVPCEKNGIFMGQITVANSDRDYDEIDLFAIKCLAAIYGLAIDKKQIKDELEAERSRVENILENAPFAVIISDNEALIQFANSEAKRECIQFLKKEGANHINFCDMKGIPYDAHDLPPIRSARYGEKIINETLIILSPEGNKKYLLVNSMPIMGRWNKISGAVTTFTDITELKISELKGIRQIEELNKQLAANRGFEESKINL